MVDGIPRSRGSSSTAARNARATALYGGEPRDARREGTDARYDESVGVYRRLGIGRHRDIGPDALERPLGRAEIARPVVEHHDALHRGSRAPARYADSVASTTESAYKSWEQALKNALRGRDPPLSRVELDGAP